MASELGDPSRQTPAKNRQVQGIPRSERNGPGPEESTGYNGRQHIRESTVVRVELKECGPNSEGKVVHFLSPFLFW